MSRADRAAQRPRPRGDRLAAGIPYIIGNEGCERFSFYGMRSILTLYLARELYVHHPAFAADAAAVAKAHFHLSSRPSSRCR